MAAKGAEAKRKVIDKIQTAFGADFIGEYDKKYYVWSQENGQKIQVAITLTCPKNPVGEVNLSGNLDFTDSKENSVIAPTKFEPAQITKEEQDTIEKLMKELNL